MSYLRCLIRFAARFEVSKALHRRCSQAFRQSEVSPRIDTEYFFVGVCSVPHMDEPAMLAVSPASGEANAEKQKKKNT